MLNKPGVSAVAELQSLDATVLIGAVSDPIRTAPEIGPIVDGDYLPRHMFVPNSALSAQGIPLLAGSNRNEYALYESANPNFGEKTMDGLRRKLGACHGAKIAYVYANATEATGSKPEVAIVEEAGCRAWIAFAHG